MEVLQSIVIYSLVWGCIYLLVALGFSIICGVLRIFHLGYGATFVLAAYLTWAFMKEAHLGLLPSIIAMLIVQVIISVLLFYKGVFERYLEEEEILLSLTVLIYLVFANLANYLYPVTAGVYLPTTIVQGSMRIGATTISNQMLATAGIGLATTGLFVVFFLKTKAGLIMRAMSQNLSAAMLMGANVNFMYYLAMSLAVLPPVIATLCIAPFWGVNPQMGLPMLMTAIVISILGGLGNLKGTIVSSFVVAFIHSTVSFLYVSRFMGLAGLIVVLLVLILRRGGIFAGERLW
jgi:branched-chain amino acid transport system permease protein